MSPRLLIPSAAALTAALLLTACGDSPSEVAAQNATPDSGADTGSGADAGTSDASDAGGPGSDAEGSTDVEEPRAQVPTTTVFVAREFVFAGETAPGQAEGFDLDNSAGGAVGVGCDRDDYVNAAGETGIDNQFAGLLPIIEAAGGAALPTLIQSAINEGDLLITVAFEGVDDWLNDDDLTVFIGRATGEPIVGADSKLQPWQTFTFDTNEPITRIDGASIVDGVLTAGPVDLPLPIFVFNFRFDVILYGALIEGGTTADGPVSIMTGGAVTMENILTIARNPGIQDRIPETLEGLGPLITDLSVNGPCDAVSTAAILNLLPVYVFNPEVLTP
jgi:hypothetical protein